MENLRGYKSEDRLIPQKGETTICDATILGFDEVFAGEKALKHRIELLYGGRLHGGGVVPDLDLVTV